MNGIVDWLVHIIESTPAWAVYLVVWGVVFGEASVLLGLVLPGETLLVAGGVAAAVGPTNVGWLLTGACIAAIAGDSTGYWVGRWSGGRITHSRLGARIGAERWGRVEAAVDTGGFVAVVTARWIGYVRTLIPFVAGMSKMNVVRYLTANVVGGVAWVVTVGMLGYLVGATLGAKILLYTAIATGCLAILWFVYGWLRSRQSSSG
ncbi:DedA family protein [Williamsia sterculiae]|uniref:Membrane-associated protein/undecaprenyl-diphosphatase n=1 Tax=Williamsia sterculiae TaxID=1344003 RepID=A0A1N7CQI2_9NOCA|nr:DedA family protein [Williamsia sterculiae]SIR65869.1 membrane-associated protein/undecaprenyl-diphosphatase [Williamsia sterculiae]